MPAPTDVTHRSSPPSAASSHDAVGVPEDSGFLTLVEQNRFPFFVLALAVEITILGVALWVSATKIVG